MSEEVEIKIFKLIKDKVNVRNVSMYYQIANLFQSTKLVKKSMSYIERCFTLVCKHAVFLELDFNLIAKIISSSELKVDSELEVLTAVEDWLSFKYQDRITHANYLLSKIRLHLLSDHCLKSILGGPTSFAKVDNCVKMLREVSKNSNTVFQQKPICSSRFCSQENFGISFSGGKVDNERTTNVVEIDGTNFKTTNHSTPIQTPRLYHEAVCCRGDLYVAGGMLDDENPVDELNYVVKYSFATKTWSDVAVMIENRYLFICFCAFMDDIYVLGGGHSVAGVYGLIPPKSSLKFDTERNEWDRVAKVNSECLHGAACAVYRGKIVISGGLQNGNSGVKIVEAYDHVCDAWQPMPRMVEARHGHSLVGRKEKLFAIGGTSVNTCEVFAGESFAALKHQPSSIYQLKFLNAFAVGTKLVMVNNRTDKIVLYDVEKDEWSQKPCEIMKRLKIFGSAIFPRTQF